LFRAFAFPAGFRAGQLAGAYRRKQITSTLSMVFLCTSAHER